MASQRLPKKKRKADPFRTRTGKLRIGPLSVKQLEEMLKSCKAKDKYKIQQRINFLQKFAYKAPQVEVQEA